MTAHLTSELPAEVGQTRTTDELRPAPGWWHPLSIPAANDLLSTGGYGLRVERSAHGTLRLGGAGAGSGLPLGDAPKWSDLYRALIRLRRTRRDFDSAWLHRLHRSLTRNDRTGGSVPLPVDRADLLLSDKRQLAKDCLAAIAGPDRSVPFPADRIVVSGPDRTVQLEAAGTRERAQRQLRGWIRLSSIVESDPDLRMHCATQPVPAAVVDADTGSAALARLAEPSPAHPAHPGGTIAAELSTLLRPAGDGAPGLLRVVLDNRFERRQDELEYFLEHFVRPLLRAFRLALDTHRTGLFVLDETGVAFELSPELQATGRIVVTDYLRVSHDPNRAEAATGARALVRTLDELSAGYSSLGAGRAGVRRAVHRVIAEELRYLAPHTADLLSGDQPLRDYAHAVPESQDAVLKSVLDRVQQRTRRRRWDDRSPQAAVIINIGHDGTNAGLARFVWDVRDAGGRVVFRTGRPDHAEAALAAAGVLDATLVCQPDDAEQQLEKLRVLGEIDVVAVFGGERADRIAVTKEFPGALAVEVPGPAAERLPDQQAAAIATFETAPGARGGPRLSNAHSLEELQIGALRKNGPARQWAVHLTERESLSIVDSMLAETDRAAERTGRGAAAKFGVDERSTPEQVMAALHHVFTRKQFIKGSRANYQPADLRRDAEPFVRRDAPIDVVLLGFPVKQCLNRLKADGPLPDLAELGGMARLRELQRAVSAVYPPGLHFNILTDGRHFRSRPYSIIEAYRKKLCEYVDLVGIGERTTIEEIDEVAERKLGPGLPDERARRIGHYLRLLADSLRHFDITDNPLRTLDRVHLHTATITEFRPQVIGLFREILMSQVYSVPIAVPSGTDRLTWAAAVYADLYNTTDHSVSAKVRQARCAVLRRAWLMVQRYLATMQVDEEFGYEQMFPNRVRLTLSAVRKGCLGFTYLGGSGVLPWQGTGVLDPRGKVAVDFAISLLDQGFVPVYSPLLGPRQPWLMVPSNQTNLTEPREKTVPRQRGAPEKPGIHLNQTFATKARLRRK